MEWKLRWIWEGVNGERLQRLVRGYLDWCPDQNYSTRFKIATPKLSKKKKTHFLHGIAGCWTTPGKENLWSGNWLTKEASPNKRALVSVHGLCMAQVVMHLNSPFVGLEAIRTLLTWAFYAAFWFLGSRCQGPGPFLAWYWADIKACSKRIRCFLHGSDTSKCFIWWVKIHEFVAQNKTSSMCGEREAHWLNLFYIIKVSFDIIAVFCFPLKKKRKHIWLNSCTFFFNMNSL